MAEGFHLYILPLGLVRLRTFRLAHGTNTGAGGHARTEQTCHSEMSIKIPDRGYDQGCEWRHAPEAWAEIWEKSVSWDWDLGEVRRISVLRAPPVMGRRWKSQDRKNVYLSPYVEKPLNSKVIKVSYLN